MTARRESCTSTTCCARVSPDPMSDPLAWHSRIVLWLKIILPLLALAVLSTLFLLSRGTAPAGPGPLAGADVADLAARPRLTRPEYSGMTRDGASVTVGARSVRPAGAEGKGASAEALAVTYERDDGFRMTVTALRGELSAGRGVIELSGQVEAAGPGGYRLRSEALTADLDRTRVESVVPVRVETPFGTIDAGGFSFTGRDASGRGDVLVFNNGVRLIYDPAKPPAGTP